MAIVALITQGGSVRNSSKRKQRAVRMLEHAVRLVLPKADPGMSDMANGRLASNLRKNVRLLKELMQDDPEDVFWEPSRRQS